MIPAKMRAAFIREPGPADTIETGLLPVPTMGPADVLVRNTVMAVNHVDTLVRSGAYTTKLPLPFIIGRDVVGTVAAMGDGVSGLAVGDTVWSNSLGHAGRQGSFAEYSLVSQERLYRLPDTVKPRDAVGVLHTAATAHIGLFREAHIQPGETIFVAGAAGGVGSAVVQMASAAGARVIASASPKDTSWCLSCGAESVIDYHDPDLVPKLGRAADGGVDVWWDSSGHHDLPAALPLLRHGGRLLLMAGLGVQATLPVGGLYTRDASILGFAISNASVTDLSRAAGMINTLLRHRKLSARLGPTLPLADAARAHRMLEEKSVTGRVLVTP